MPIPNLSKCSFWTGNTAKQDLKASTLSKDAFLLHAVPAHLHLSPFSMFLIPFSQQTARHHHGCPKARFFQHRRLHSIVALWSRQGPRNRIFGRIFNPKAFRNLILNIENHFTRLQEGPLDLCQELVDLVFARCDRGAPDSRFELWFRKRWVVNGGQKKGESCQVSALLGSQNLANKKTDRQETIKK